MAFFTIINSARYSLLVLQAVKQMRIFREQLSAQVDVIVSGD